MSYSFQFEIFKFIQNLFYHRKTEKGVFIRKEAFIIKWLLFLIFHVLSFPYYKICFVTVFIRL